MRQERDLTKGAIVKSLWLFALPLMLGNVLQQLYNLVDTWVVGRYLGKRALAAVGASYTLMTFLTSVVIGLCLGAGAFFAMAYGRREKETFRNGIFMSFTAIGGLSIVLTILLYGFVRPLTYLLQVPAETVEDMPDMRTYLVVIFAGISATFLYNYFASAHRSIGNSVLPLVFLGISVALNIGLDLLFVVTFSFGIAGAAVATVISQYIAGIGLMFYFLFRYSDLCPAKKDFIWEKKNFRQILSLSGFTCLQQSVMNFGILMIQGLVNSFGTTIMAAFSVAVKIDTIAYMPVQDFGNAFSFFVAQNYGAKKYTRIRKGFLLALVSVLIFCLAISAVVFGFADSLMGFFTNEGSAVSAAGAEYLRVEGAFYVGIGILFLLYGYYRAVDKPVVSVVLTIISLGTRVILAYALTGLFHTGVVPAALQGIRAADDQLHITADRDCRTGSIDIDIMQRHFCCRGAAFDGQGVGRLVVVCGNDQIRYLLFDVLLFGILLAVLNGNDNAAVAEIHRCDRLRDIILHIQHAHRAFGGGALLEQGIGACGQSRGGKAEHHACCQRSGSRPPGQNISFHRGSSFAEIITGGYILQYLDYPTLYRILEANLRESP